ncbi:hypothetical protein [Brevibacterium antiquum]|uniref:Uncharacterized protein n=1 Tax=Brevibacterium antiquum TaxID=234835 RepID=A0A2H1IP95_9MICO|nr:hypothetical protein [Brevibacterium antiquum]SMX76988.1 hypothetical protein BANT10_01157 [Brevibacterium antiquum]
MRHFILVLAAAATTFLIGAAAAVLTHKQIDLTMVLTWIFNTALITGIVEYARHTGARSTHGKDDPSRDRPASPRANRQ